MGSGIYLPDLSDLVVSPDLSVFKAKAPSIRAPWRPTQWGNGNPQVVMMVETESPPDENASPDSPDSRGTKDLTTYVFDAVFRTNHCRTVKKTSHPVLTGANISDHAYVEPVVVTLEIGMSDAMASYRDDMWKVGDLSKSVSAWQILKQIELSRQLVMLGTRLDMYYNMLITRCSASDTYRTAHGLMVPVTFEEIIAGTVVSNAVSSARPDENTPSPTGVINGQPVNPTQAKSHIDSSFDNNPMNFGSLPSQPAKSKNEMPWLTPDPKTVSSNHVSDIPTKGNK